MSSRNRPRNRLKLLALLFLVGSMLAAVAFACGSSGDTTPVQGEAGVGGDAGGAIDANSDGPIVVDASKSSDAGNDAPPPDAACPTGHAGDLDTSFGDNGFLTFKGILSSGAYAIVEQPDGKLLVGGAHHDVINRFTVIRLLPNGDLDATFGTFGIASMRVGVIRTPEQPETIFGLALRPDGRIVAAGEAASTDDAGAVDFAVARYLPDGRPDTTFGSGGSVLTDFKHQGDRATAVALLADGRFVVAGLSGNGTPTDFAIARYSSDGALDPTFGLGGRVTMDFRGTQDQASSVVITADGGLLVSGSSYKSVAGGGGDLALLRLTSTGSPDPLFADGGKYISSSLSVAWATLVESGGRFVVAGQALGQFGVTRVTPDGRLDLTFGDAGASSTVLGFTSGATTLLAEPDGKLTLVGFTAPKVFEQDGIGIARYSAAGGLDQTFGDGGAVTAFSPPTTGFFTQAAAGTKCFIYAVAPYAYVIGSVNDTTWGVARFYR